MKILKTQNCGQSFFFTEYIFTEYIIFDVRITLPKNVTLTEENNLLGIYTETITQTRLCNILHFSRL